MITDEYADIEPALVPAQAALEGKLDRTRTLQLARIAQERAAGLAEWARKLAADGHDLKAIGYQRSASTVYAEARYYCAILTLMA